MTHDGSTCPICGGLLDVDEVGALRVLKCDGCSYRREDFRPGETA